MAINEKVKRLYDVLNGAGAQVGTEDEFNEWFFRPGEEGYKNRKRVYDTFKAEGAEVGKDYEEFAGWLNLQPVQKETTAPNGENGGMKLNDVQGTVMGGVAGGVEPGSYAQNFAYGLQNGADKNISLEDLRSDLEARRQKKAAEVQEQQDAAVGNVKQNEPEKSTIFGGGSSVGGGASTSSSRKSNIGYNKYTGILKTDPTTGEKYYTYPGYSQAQDATNISELQGNNMVDEEGRVIGVSGGTWSPKYIDDRNRLFLPGSSIWYDGGLNYRTPLDNHIAQAIDLGMKASDHSNMSVDQLKAKRNEILGKYSNGFTSSPESLQDAIDLNDIDYELTARSLNYNSKKDMLANRGHADFELNKARVNQDDLRFYERQGTNLDQNPLYVFGWQKLVDKIQNDQKMGMNANMTADGYIDYLMQDPNIESKFYAYTLYRASKNNRSWKENIDEVLDDFRESLERGENKHALAPDEKDVMAQYYGGELDRMDAEYEKELEAWQERVNKWSANRNWGGWEHDRLGIYSAETGDDTLSLITTAQNLSKDARNIINEGMKSNGGFSLSGEVGAFTRGFANSAFDWRTWTFGVSDLHDNANMYNVAKKWGEGKQLTKAEQLLLDQMLLKTASEEFFKDYLTTGYEAGQATGYALEFIVEMMTGAGAATDAAVRAMGTAIKKLGKKKVVQLLERIGMKSIIEGTLKKLGRSFEKVGSSKIGKAIQKGAKVGGKVLDEAISVANKGLGQTFGPGIAKVPAGAYEGATGQVKGRYNPKTGRMEVTGFENMEDFFTSTITSAKRQFGENASEFLGDRLFDPGIKFINNFYRKASNKAFKKFGMEDARAFLDSLKGSDWYRFTQDFRKQIHYNGSFGEYCEEVANNIYNAAFVGDQNFNSPDDPNSVFNFKQNWRTYASCKFMSLAFGTANVIGYRTPKYRAKKDIDRADEIAKRAFRGQDWGSIAASIRNGSDEQVQQLMVDIARSKKYNARQREAAIKYAGAVYALKGIEAGEPKKIPDTPAEGQLKEMYGRGYNMENYQAISDANGAYERAKQGVAWIPPEMLQMIDEEPAYVYEWAANNPNWSEQEKQQLFDYLNAKATYEGAQARLKDDEASIRADVESGIDQRTNKKNEDGTGGDNMIHPVVLKNGKRVYVTGGNVEQDSQGKITSDTNDLIVVDEDNNTSMIAAKDIETVEEVENPDGQKQVANDVITQGLAETTDATATDDAVVDEDVEQGGEGADGTGAVGNYDGVLDAMGIEDAEARQALNETWGQTPPADAMDVLNDLMGETNPEQRESNKEYWEQQPEVFNSQWRYMMGDVTPDQVTAALAAQNETAAAAAQGQAQVAPQAQAAAAQSQPQPSTPTPQAATTPGHYEQDDDVVLNVGGEQITGFISNVTPDGKLRLQLDAPIDGNMVIDVTPEELDKMVAQPQDSGEVSGESGANGANGALAPQDGTAASAPTTPTAAPEAPQQESAQPSLPVGEDGNADFSNATPQEAHDYIYNDPELDEEEANQVVQNYADSAAEELAKAQAVLDELKSMPAPQMKDYGRDMAGYKRDKKERNDSIAQAQAAVDAAQREVDLWNDVQAQHMMASAPDVTNQGVPASEKREEGNVESGEAAAPAAPQETASNTQAPAPQEESSMLSANESGEPSSTQTNEGESGEETTPAAEEELTPDERIERARMEALENRAEELAESCGLPVQVARSLDDLSDSHRRQVEKQHAEGKYVNGFYDPKTKQIVLFMPDIAKNGGMRRLERTFLHEGVAHGGLRALFENAQNGIQTFDELCDQVWEMMPVTAQASMMNYIGVKKPEDMTQEKKRIAADEYMAHLAEWGVEQSVKTRIINAIKNALRKIGIKMKLNNNDIVSLLAASRRNLNEMDKVAINSAISEALDNDGEGDGEGVRMSTTAIFEGAGLEVSRDATDNEGKLTKEPLTDNKGNLVARIGDKEYSVDNPVTAADLKKGDEDKKERTVLQMLINDAREAKNITEEQADKIYQNYADLLNMYLYTGSAELGGPDAVKENWEWLGDSVFRTIAANGDAQYSYSMDIIRVCKKNEAVIKAMSALQLREGRGATPSEIVELHRETHEDGYQVPCPVCYVFTRYIRNGKYASAAIKGMEKWGDHLPGGSDVWSVDQWLDALDKIQRETNPDYKPDGKNKMKGEELEKAKRFKKQLDQANKITVAYEKRVNALSYLLTTDDAIKVGTIKNKVLELTPERRASIEKELEIINEQYQHAVEIIAHQALSNWIKTHAIEEKEGKWQMREDAKKPEDIDDYKRNALDLRLTSNTIVNYPAIQRLRKSGGSAAGKEISFASDNRLGEVVSGLGINKTNLSGYKNKYEEALNATGRARNKARNEARKRFKDATVYALMQTLRGGQRMWSWSDNIERLSPDIAINIMQLQLLGGAMQTYSKQLEGIKLAAQMGAYVNGSLMAKDNGYQEVTDKDVEERDGKLWLNHDITDEVEEYPVGGGEPKPRKRIVAAKGSYVYQAEDGKKYVLIYDDVVGVDPFGNELHGKGKKKGLFQLNQEYDRAGNILVGMNDLHVRAAMADPRVFFIIPWHASGANNHILNQMLNILEQTMTDRLDYTAMQEEKNMLERNKKTKKLPEVNQRLRDLWEEGRQWAKENKWKSGMEVDSNGDVITESQYMYRQLRAQIFNGNIFEAMPSEEQYRAAVQTVESMQPTVDAIAARNEAWKAKSPEYKKSPEGKAEKKAIEQDKNRTNKKYKEALHYIELHDGLIDWRDSSQHEGDAEWQEQHPKRINVEEARRMIENDEFLSQVLKRVEPIGHMTNGDNTYIYPYEYWQETDKKGNPADIKDADINGKRYVEYCRRMGYKPKFSGRWGDKATEENMNDGNFVHDPGYWKLLIDRRMYDRKGKYQWLDPVESENFEPDLVNPLKTGEEFNITQVADDKDAEDIAERVYNNMAERDGGVAKVDYSKPLEKIMDEYDAALAAGVQANVKLTDAEEDALDDMEEAMEEEGEDSEVMFSTSRIAEAEERRDSDESKRLFDATKEKFGTTNDLREAGYILPDGTMLDFSGRYMIDEGYDASHLAGRRAVDHRAIHEVGYDKDENETGYDTNMQDFIGRGAIRIDANAGSINLSMPPTAAQARVLRSLVMHSGGNVTVDFGDGYDSEHYAEYDSARPTRVLGDIDRYFSEGIKPKGNVLFSTSPTFYSNAERAVENIKQNKATAEQWKAMLTKAGGIKAGEDKWMGLSTWLDENKGKSLTKDEVLQFVRDNGIQMEEVNYGEGLDENAIYNRYGLGDYNFDGEALPWTEWFDLSPNGISFQGNHDDRFQLAEIVNNQDHFVNPRDYDLNRTDGEENFINDVEEELFKFIQKEKPANGNTINSMRLPYTTDGLENKREIAFKVPTIEPYQVHDEVHFGPENQGKAVMWVRFGETTDADGNRVLVIDEIQSNRHQDAREKGYRKSIEDYRNSGYRVERNSSNNGNLIYDKDGNFIELVYDNERPQGVPAAPFEKNWHEVAMKRMLRLAAEEGFDKVAWTTGEQQVERYGLEKVLSSINSSDWGDNIGIEDTKVVTLDYKSGDAEDLIVNRNGEIVADVDDRYINKTLADVVGKEMSDKLLVDGEVAISGNGLRIGGEGMKGFYDQMLPRFMDKYGKRWGVKTGTVELPNVEEAGRTMHAVDVTPEMKESVMQGQPLFSTSEAVGALKDDERVYNDLLGKVFSGVSNETRRGIVGDAMENRGYDFGAATEAWLMGLADDETFAQVPQEDWRAVKNALGNVLRENGVEGSMTDNEARYVLWEAGQIEDGVFSMAEDIVKRDELLNGASAPQYTDNADVRFSTSESEEDDIRYSVTPRDRAIARDQYERWMKNGRLQWVEAMQDSMLGLKKLMQSIMGDKWTKIEDIPTYENPYVAENLMSSVGQSGQAAYSRDFMSPLLEEIGKICKGRKRERERKREELTDYLLAKHGLERNQVFADRDAKETAEAGGDYQEAYAENRERDYSGLTALTGEDDVHAAEAKAQQMVDDYEAQHDTTELWRRINAATQASLEKQFTSGILSRENYEKIKSMFDFYVPLRGWAETTSDEVYGYLTSKDGPLTGGSIVKGADGRTSEADDPIATIGKLADDSIRTAQRNLMKQTFLNFVRNHPSDAVSVSELWLQYDATKDEWVPVFPNMPADASPSKVGQIIEQFEADMQQLAQQEPDKYKHGRETANIPYKVIPGNEREHQVLVKMRGQTYVLTINGNPRAAQALNGITNPDVKTAGHVDAAINWFEKVNRYLSSVFTTYNPAFLMSNFLRDSIYSNNMVWVKENPNYALKFNVNYYKTNPIKMRKLLGKWENGTLDESKSMEKMFKEFMENGGETGYAMAQDLKDYKKKVQRELSTMNGRNFHKKIAYAVDEQYELLGRAIENCARFAAFVTSREMGRDPIRSAYDAKEISVNFNKKGSGGKTFKLNGQTRLGNIAAFVGGWARSLFTFWNAGVQGMANAGRAVKRHPVKAAALLFSKFFALGFFAPMIAAAMGAGDGDDDDKNAYYNLPEYVRRSNICIYIGGAEKWLKGTWAEKFVHGTYIAIPLPIEFRAIYGLGELTYGVTSGNERYGTWDLIMQYAGQFSQLLPIDMLEGGGGFNAFIPTLAKPVVEAYVTNKSWSGSPVYKPDKYDDDEFEPSFKKVFSNTSGWIVGLSEWSNEVTGGTDATQGWWDWNPAKLEYVIKGFMGGAYTFPADVFKSYKTVTGDYDFEWRNIPFANRVLKQGDERTEAKNLKGQYFKYQKEYKKVKHDLKALENGENPDLYDYAKKIDILNHSKEYGHYLIFDDMSAAIAPYHKAAGESSDPDSQKAYEDMEVMLMRNMVNMINDYDDGKPVDSDAAKRQALQDAVNNATDSVLVAEARKELAKIHGAKDSLGSNKTEYNKRYTKLSKAQDVEEDAMLQQAKKKAKDLGKKDLYEAYDRASDELTALRKGVHTKKKNIKGLGEGDTNNDMAIMEKVRKRRAEILKMTDAEILKNFPKKK